MSIHLSIYLFICLSIHLSIYSSVCLSIYIHLLIYLSSFDIFTYPFVYLGLSLERKVSLSSKTLDKSLQSSLFHCHQISGLCKQKPIVISKTTLGSPHSRNTCPQKEQSIYSNNISKILRWETPTIQHSRVITIPYTISLPPTPNHLTLQLPMSTFRTPLARLLPSRSSGVSGRLALPKWWHCQHGGNGNSVFSRLPEAQGRRRPFMLRWCWSASSWRRRRCVHGASKHADVSWLGTWNSDPWTLKRNVSSNPHLFLLQRVTKYHSLTMTCIILDSKKLWSILLVVCQRLISFGGWGVQYAQIVCCNAAVN